MADFRVYQDRSLQAALDRRFLSRTCLAHIKEDYERISRGHFAPRYFYPDGMSFARSDARFPPEDLAATRSREYDAQCRMLGYGAYPTWADALAVFTFDRRPKSTIVGSADEISPMLRYQ